MTTQIKTPLDAAALLNDSLGGTAIDKEMDALVQKLLACGDSVEDARAVLDTPETKESMERIEEAMKKVFTETPGFEHFADNSIGS